MFQLGSLNKLREYFNSIDNVILSIELKIHSQMPTSWEEMDFPYVSSSNLIALRIFSTYYILNFLKILRMK